MTKVYRSTTLLLITSSISIFCFSCSNNQVNKNIENLTPAVAYAKVSKTKANMGDKIVYELNTERDPKVTLIVPKLEKYFKDFEINKNTKDKPQVIDNRIVDKYIIEFQSFNTGSYILEPIEIKYLVPKELTNKFGKNGNVKTSKIFIDIKDLTDPKSKENEEIDDIKPLEKIPVVTPAIIAIFSFISLILILGLFYILKILKKPEKVLLPHEKAILSLSKITNTNDKEFYFTLSEIIRVYLSERFEIHAIEQPSPDIVNSLKENNELNDIQKDFIKDFLDKTDFYKFTDYKPEKNYSEKLLEQSNSFVNETKKIPEVKNAK